MKDSRFPIAPLATKLFLGVFVLGAIFGLVILFELQAPRPSHGSELVGAPHPLIPVFLAGYSVAPDPASSDLLAKQYRAADIPVTDVESAFIRIRNARATISAAKVSEAGVIGAAGFRAGVLAGAASAYGIDPHAHPFRYSVVNKVVVYINDAEVGRLSIWFFRDAFEELFVPSEIVDEASPLQRSILQAERASK